MAEASPVRGPLPGAVEPGTKPWSGGGREELADAVRRLMVLTVTAAAPPEVLTEAARRAGMLADELEPHVPAAGVEPVARFADHPDSPREAHTLSAAMPFDVVIGSCNPVALPLTVEFDPPKAVARATFTPVYEGAPGCVHGAVLAGAFDIVLTAANIIADGAGPTVQPVHPVPEADSDRPAGGVRGLGHRADRPAHLQPGSVDPGRCGDRRSPRGVRHHGPVADPRHAPPGRHHRCRGRRIPVG